MKTATQFARPTLTTAGDGAHAIAFRGLGDQVAIQGLLHAVRTVRLDPDAERVLIAFDCPVCVFDLAAVLAELEALRRAKPLTSCIRTACGPALLLALCANDVIAAPTASLGGLVKFDCCDPVTVQLIRAAVIGEAAGLRPAVSLQTWSSLLFRTVVGEQAEALGIVDELMAVDWGDK